MQTQTKVHVNKYMQTQTKVHVNKIHVNTNKGTCKHKTLQVNTK